MWELVSATGSPPLLWSLPPLKCSTDSPHFHHWRARTTSSKWKGTPHVLQHPTHQEHDCCQAAWLPRESPPRAARPPCPPTACCQHKRNCGCPYLHNKDVFIRNLWLLFAKVPKVVINDYGSVKDWFREASHESYWTQLVQCLLDNFSTLTSQMWHKLGLATPIRHWPHPTSTLVDIASNKWLRKPD